jgi:DNA-binding response OmpR family regulator
VLPVPLKVLLVETESAGPYSVEPDLLDQGHQVTKSRTPVRASSVALADWPDLIILNACGGQLDLADICQALDETEFAFPRLVVSRDEVHRHVAADAYLPAPYSPHQLGQHIKKALRGQANRFLRVGETALDMLTHQVQRQERRAHLTPKEFKLLRLLMENADTVLNRGQIMKEVWETDYLGDTRTLDVHIRWLREKLEDNASRPQHIITVRGVGYRFSPG